MSSKKEIYVLRVSCCDVVCLITYFVSNAFFILLQREDLLAFRDIQIPTGSECL